MYRPLGSIWARATAKVVAQLDWEGGGSYALPEITIAAGASYRLDFAELIQEAKPDLLERELNSSYQKGFFRWSARGGSRKLLARTEVGPVAGGQFGFNCTGCCLEFPYGAIEPGNPTVPVGQVISTTACEYRNTCSGGLLGPFYASSPLLTVPSPFTWNGFTLRASGPGRGTLSFSATGTQYDFINGVCVLSNPTIADSKPSVAPQVEIISADVTTNQIKVKLSPSGLSGNFTLKLANPNTHTLLNAVTRVSGTHTETFNIPGLPTGEYKQVQVIWKPEGVVTSAVHNYHIEVLGTYRHTKYNTPTESFCSDNTTGQFKYNDNNNCGGITCGTVDWTSETGKSKWLGEVEENGSGKHSRAGILSKEWICSEPPPITGRRMRKVPAPCPSCGGTLRVGESVARNAKNKKLPCGTKVYVHGVGIVKVQDAGGRLATNQLDHYIGTSGCNKYGGSHGYRKTIKLSNFAN